MLESIDVTSIFSFSVACVTVVSIFQQYMKNSERLQKREHEQELMKVRMYTDRDIRTAQIENTSMAQGFNTEAYDDGFQGLLNMALKNPDIVNQFIEKIKNK